MKRGDLEVIYRVVNVAGEDDCDLTRAEALKLYRALQAALRQKLSDVPKVKR